MANQLTRGFKSLLPDRVKNYLFPTSQGEVTTLISKPGSHNLTRNVGNYAVPIQLYRIRQDIMNWRKGIEEMERVYIPQRVIIQQLYLDTTLNSQVKSAMNRRKRLTMLRDFKICNVKGVESEYLKQVFRNTTSSVGMNETSSHWFDSFMSYSLDALAFGYSLISLGDVVNGGFPNLMIMKRWLTSPDRLVFTAFPYSVMGESFVSDPYKDWHVYISTPSDHGVSPCGYGYLLEAGAYEILLRNNLGYNADFNEVFNMPMTLGHTTKTEPSERNAFEYALSKAGSLRWALLDEGQDKIEFVESKNVGTAYQSFEKFSERLEKYISKLILGHADALDSTPGRLGQQGTKKGITPVDQALDEVQTTDGIFMQNVFNTMLFPRMRKFGFDIPIDYHFEFKNDNELEEVKEREVDLAKKYADMALAFFQAGKQINPQYIEDQLGIPVTDIPVQAAPEPKPL